ncbi:hypothetical protein AB0877_30570 [Micromonospora sp. NPDC047644]|uniref:hypothetical protein n=1 Tax=Micromonospora sp. NPDC047644 TaxID=3157203 RepID=UPI003451759B
MIHHVLLACPRATEEVSRAFYAGLLGPVEKPNPPARRLTPALDSRGGAWTAAAGRSPRARRFTRSRGRV